MNQKKIQAIELPAMKYRAKNGLSHEERVRQRIRSVPRNAPGEFDEFTCSWNSFSSPKLTAGLIQRLTAAANEGSPSEQALLYRSMLEKEPVAAAHLQTRILSVLACDWSIQCEDEARAEEVAGLLREARLHSLLRHLLDALALGYSGAAILWEEGGGTIRSFKKINGANWNFDLAGNPALTTLSGKVKPLSEYHPSQFVFHTHKLQSGPGQRGGLLRPLLWLYFFKHYAMRDRARYLEKYGIPFIIAKIRNDDFENETVRASILQSLSKVGSDGAGVVTEGSELQLLDSNSGTSSDYQSWMDYIDRLFTLLILGQTASSSDASGFSRGQIQENVRCDILEADCRNLMETVNTQILAPLEQYRYGTSGTLRFHLDFSAPENLMEKASIVKTLADSGFRADPLWIRKTFGIELEKGVKI
ncbi:MAG: hypothetical protein BWY31_02868 [Lentisphaerae bacterium ADurb.Bin242]|nr:MAG: hypothetical protein BWY31_02868 [Lentisphaerae bacterium ADurb.Bin242]